MEKLFYNQIVVEMNVSEFNESFFTFLMYYYNLCNTMH